MTEIEKGQKIGIAWKTENEDRKTQKQKGENGGEEVKHGEKDDKVNEMAALASQERAKRR